MLLGNIKANIPNNQLKEEKVLIARENERARGWE
jgi:hypothetical protein